MESRHSGWPDSLWPNTLRLSARPPKLIYFDLNHWIGLSKAYSGHRDGKNHRCILDKCLKAVKEGKAVFPLSMYIYTEILKITNYRQRHDLREVIEQVSRYMVITPLSVVAVHEIEAVLDRAVGPNPEPINTTSYLDWGVDRAYGRVGGITIESASGEDVTEDFRRTYPSGPQAFDTILANAQLELNRKAIEGPTTHEEPRLRALGWNPESVIQRHEQKASDELEQVRRFNQHPKWRLGRIRDVIMVREVSVEVNDIFAEGFAARGPRAFDQFFNAGPDYLRSVYGSMPSFNVAVSLKVSLHRDPNHKWTNNDIYDIWALALTIPYCDVVVTDRAMWSHATRQKLHDRYNTVVISQLAELHCHL